MPRMARVELPGHLVHIMAHSVENKNLFIDDQDKKEFLSRFEKGLTDTGFKCLTWVLMSNHYHLFVRVNEKPLSKLMRGLNGGYALYYNKRHKKHGYLFQGRFKSISCQDINYAVQLIKYINLNPLRAGMIKSLEELKTYPWCGHGYLLGDDNTHGKNFQNRNECLSRFDLKDPQNAIKRYIESIAESCNAGNELAGALAAIEEAVTSGSFKGYPSVIGDPVFVADTIKKIKEYQSKMHRKADYPFILQTISEEICKEYNITLNELRKRGRKNVQSEARAVFCYRLHEKEFIPQSVIARFLGISISPVAVLIQKGIAICEAVAEVVPA